MPTGAKVVYENCFDVEQLTVPVTLDVLEDELVPASKWWWFDVGTKRLEPIHILTFNQSALFCNKIE